MFDSGVSSRCLMGSMKKRQFTTFLLIWLFSQQLFAAVWTMPHANVDCVSDGQNDCFSDITHIGHIMPSNKDSSSPDISTMCDHCSALCQPSLISHNHSNPLKEVHLSVEGEFISAPIHAFPRTLYRPPILA